MDSQMFIMVQMAISIRNLCDQNIALTERVASLECNEELILRALDGLTTVVGRLSARESIGDNAAEMIARHEAEGNDAD